MLSFTIADVALLLLVLLCIVAALIFTLTTVYEYRRLRADTDDSIEAV